jgi:hypothetical protein
MRKLIQRLTALILIGIASAAGAQLVIVEQAVEMQPLDLQLTSANSGLVYANTCADCKPMQLIITRTTQASFAGRPVALTDLKQYADLGATVFYDKATRIVTRIVVWK